MIVTPGMRQPGRASQATQVEQARAVAETQAAVLVAQNIPRSLTRALADMRESCQQKALADRAFFRYPRAGETVTGETIQLARELARCWGNVSYGISELSRDDRLGESEMYAFAWDLQTNTRASTTFIVKHLRDTKTGTKPLTEQRDVYENNANMGARRLREQIFAILPKWFSEEAVGVCRQTLRGDTRKPFAQRKADAISLYGRIGVSPAQLETKIGAKPDDWVEDDLVTLGVVYQSIVKGEINKDAEFPPRRVTVEELESPEQQPDKAKLANGKRRAQIDEDQPPADDQPGTPDTPPPAQGDEWPEPAKPGGGRK